jgi:hypothetical protein
MAVNFAKLPELLKQDSLSFRKPNAERINMVGVWNFGTISKNRPSGGATRQNSIRMTSVTSKQPRSLIGWAQQSMLFRKTFSEFSLRQT